MNYLMTFINGFLVGAIVTILVMNRVAQWIDRIVNDAVKDVEL